MKEIAIVVLVIVFLIVLTFVVDRLWTPRVVKLLSDAVVETRAQAPKECSRCTAMVPTWFVEQLGGEQICFKCTANYAYPLSGEDEDTYTVKLQKSKEEKLAAACETGPSSPGHIFDEPPRHT